MDWRRSSPQDPPLSARLRVDARDPDIALRDSQAQEPEQATIQLFTCFVCGVLAS